MSSADAAPVPPRPAGVPIGFSSEAEYETWKAELHSATNSLRQTAEAIDRREAEMVADMARDGIFGGIPLPAEVREALSYANRIAGFLPFVPDTAKPHWADKLAEVLSLVSRALGVR